MSLGPRTIHGQITAIIVFALLIVVTAGPVLERWVRDYEELDIEQVAERLQAIAEILAAATPDRREIIVGAAHRSGWDLTLQPLVLSEQFTTSSSKETFWDRALDWLFPPDNSVPPLGGWRTFLNDNRVVAFKVDDATMLVTPISSDSFLWDNFTVRGSYYLVALITLIFLLSAFAIWAITLPLRRISRAAINADISTHAEVFEERGSVEIIALAKALNGMRNRIAIMMESRTRMLRGISHDLRTPLTRLRLRAERLPEGPTRDTMLSDINHIDRLLGESLGYLRDNHSQEAVERTDIASTLQTICSEFADVGFDVTYRGPNRLITNCKPLAITRAVTNLCDNATKFGSSVIVELREDAGMTIIDVIDDGPGIPEPNRARVLEPFFKIDDARGGANSGFGLGLSIVAEIVQAHGGKLEFLERQPNGLVVRMTLPMH
ncbi:two-component sensor histidine kinase [Phyllobacterium phragmitis]|uniref:histidine kinase n=1 Tax=Phyllobacterium phragmitis TaxID=2670329 RepID=A0A2S9IU25_9HYPH|nr:ATP-binding protein [Phyllobacterium phragmitis]PRD44024.1 two-component sensor histidine kinase [Phyllobacterium phragmitis]